MASYLEAVINALFFFIYTSALCLFLFGIWAALVSIRNAYFHPLSKFPGPKSAAATPIPYVKALVKGEIVKWVSDLHAKYGEVVRITPDELSFISPSAWQDIYTTKPQLPKVEKGNLRGYFGVPVLATETVTEKHTRQRRAMAPAFSERALREQESILKEYTDLLVKKLNDQVVSTEKSSVTLDIRPWYNFTTFDTIGDLLFNDPFHSLESSADHPWVEAVYAGAKFGLLTTAFHHFPPLPAVARRLMPRSLSEKAEQHFRWSQEKIRQRIENKTSRPDFMTYVLGNGEGEAKMTREEMDSNGSFLVLAGSETNALTCASTTWFFLKNPAVYDRLKKEIREAFKTMDEITVAASSKLPYLHAVINEALRLHPPAAVAAPRLVDRPGVVVSGHEIPVGVRPTRSK
ncbi:MAG: hypothetical protein LQ344_002302 [Seirophora lacunosa]|nr:MAG: hypothetical protein LQ344_002302 [Seirophora lacunosa]